VRQILRVNRGDPACPDVLSGRYRIRPAVRKVERYCEFIVIREGEIPYPRALEWQRRIHAERAAGSREDTLLLLTHPKTVTLGRGSDPAHLLLTPEGYRERGVEVYETDRGGDVTWHGPGQLVGYPIVDLRARGIGPREFLRRLELSLMLLLGSFGMESGRVPGLTGVWVGDAKIAALGIRISRGVSQHGFALNVTTDPREFDLIVPCGLRDHGVTSMTRVLDRELDIGEVADRYPDCLVRALGASDPGPDFSRGPRRIGGNA
jgi:lipoyl(octanoyl) transferase